MRSRLRLVWQRFKEKRKAYRDELQVKFERLRPRWRVVRKQRSVELKNSSAPPPEIKNKQLIKSNGVNEATRGRVRKGTQDIDRNVLTTHLRHDNQHSQARTLLDKVRVRLRQVSPSRVASRRSRSCSLVWRIVCTPLPERRVARRAFKLVINEAYAGLVNHGAFGHREAKSCMSSKKRLIKSVDWWNVTMSRSYRVTWQRLKRTMQGSRIVLRSCRKEESSDKKIQERG